MDLNKWHPHEQQVWKSLLAKIAMWYMEITLTSTLFLDCETMESERSRCFLSDQSTFSYSSLFAILSYGRQEKHRLVWSSWKSKHFWQGEKSPFSLEAVLTTISLPFKASLHQSILTLSLWPAKTREAMGSRLLIPFKYWPIHSVSEGSCKV